MDSADTTVSLKVANPQWWHYLLWCLGGCGVRVYVVGSMDSADTLTQGTLWFYYFVHLWMIRVSMDSTDTLTEALPANTTLYILG